MAAPLLKLDNSALVGTRLVAAGVSFAQKVQSRFFFYGNGQAALVKLATSEHVL